MSLTRLRRECRRCRSPYSGAWRRTASMRNCRFLRRCLLLQSTTDSGTSAQAAQESDCPCFRVVAGSRPICRHRWNTPLARYYALTVRSPPLNSGSVVSSAKHHQSVVQHADLKILRLARAHGQRSQHREEAVQVCPVVTRRGREDPRATAASQSRFPPNSRRRTSR